MTRFTHLRPAIAALLLSVVFTLPRAQGLVPQSAHAAGGPTALQAGILGYWHNAAPHTRDVTLIHVHYDAFWHEDFVDTWARCFPEDCSWGVERITWVGADAEANYNLDLFSSNAHSLLLRRVGSHLAGSDAFVPFLGDPRPVTIAHFTLVPGVRAL
jgi:hypothetical protein